MAWRRRIVVGVLVVVALLAPLTVTPSTSAGVSSCEGRDMALHASCVVQVDFNGDGSWVDVSEFARSASWRRGRSNEFESVNAGRARVVLSNADRRFDPEHATGPFYGKLKPRKRIRIGMAYADGNSYSRFGASRELTAYTYWQFYGYVDGWPQSYNGPNDATVEVSATDAFGRWARSHVPSVWQQTIESASPSAWYRLGESSGTQAADSSGNKKHGTYDGGATFNSRAGLVYGDNNNAIEFSSSEHRVSFGSTPLITAYPFTVEAWIQMPEPVGAKIQLIFQQIDSTGMTDGFAIGVGGTDTPTLEGYAYIGAVSGGLTQRVVRSSSRVDDKQVYHVAFVAASASDFKVYLNGADVSTVDTAGSPTFTPQPAVIGNQRDGIANGDPAPFVGTIDEVVIYDGTALTADEVAAHRAAGYAPWENDTAGERFGRLLDFLTWPEADRDIDLTSASLIPATLETNTLDHVQAVETTEGGRLFISRDGNATLVGRQNMWSEAVYNTSNATFGDGAGELGYAMRSGDLFDYDDTKIVNDARVRQYGGSEQVASDITSQDDYGLMSRNESSLEARPGVVLGRAEYLVHKHKDPAVRVPTITLKPERAPDSYYPALLAADLGYRYTVKRRPQNVGSAISKEVHLEGVAWSVTPGDIEVTFELSPAEPEFWILDTSTLETGSHIARLAY